MKTMIVPDEAMSDGDYRRLCDLIYREAGIHLGADKKIMLEARVKRRVKDLDLGSFAEYCDRLFTQKGIRDEIVPLIDVVTTNKTDFFREPRHFDFLTSKALPEFAARAAGKPFLIWSAGCSTGEEPYTMAIVLSEYAAAHPGFRFRILATDISTQVLEKAHDGVYTEEVASPVPASLKKKYFLRSRDRSAGRVRVVPELRKLVEFRRLNFMEDDFGVREKADAIFCRNVIIYFDRATQERILKKLSRHLATDGYMFVGHAETLHGMDLPLKSVAPSLYRRVDAAP